MKTLSLTLFLLVGFTLGLMAQNQVNEDDLEGQWKLVIDLTEEHFEEEWDEESALGRFIARTVTDLVENIMEEVDIRFEFLSNHRLRVTAKIFDEREVEYTDWYINRDSELKIGDSKHLKIDDDDDIWLMEDGVLVSYEKKWDDDLHYNHVYLIKLDY